MHVNLAGKTSLTMWGTEKEPHYGEFCLMVWTEASMSKVYVESWRHTPSWNPNRPFPVHSRLAVSVLHRRDGPILWRGSFEKLKHSTQYASHTRENGFMRPLFSSTEEPTLRIYYTHKPTLVEWSMKEMGVYLPVSVSISGKFRGLASKRMENSFIAHCRVPEGKLPGSENMGGKTSGR